jgi:lipocalin
MAKEEMVILVIIIIIILLVFIYMLTRTSTNYNRDTNFNMYRYAWYRSLGPLIAPDKTFDVNAYMGQWYEAARLPAPFQVDSKGLPLENVTANYSLVDGKLTIVNCAVSPSTGQKTCASAIGQLTNTPGIFDVSFFPGMSAKYIILALSDKDQSGQYQTAVVGSENKDMLWLLSRKQPSSDANQYIMLLKDVGRANGYSEETLNKIIATKF